MNLRRLFVGLVLGGFCLELAACSIGGSSFMAPRGAIAASQKHWFFQSLLIMLIVVGPVLVLTPFFAWKYRHGRRRAAYSPDWGAVSIGYEALIWGPPIVIVGVLTWLVCGPERAIDPYHPVSNLPAEEVDVVALDWKWLFIYPQEGIATVGVLAFPVDRQLSLHLTSDSTMQSFFIPALGSQIYAMAGMVTRLHLAADRPITVAGENTQYNGEGFQNDRFNVHVMQPADFRTFVTAVRAQGAPLDASGYATLHKPGTTQDARRQLHLMAGPPDSVWFSSVPADLFRRIVAHYKDPQAHAMQAMAPDMKNGG